MEIKNVTITAEASKAYQKYCVSLTAENLGDGDMEALKKYAIREATHGINLLTNTVEEPKVEVKTTPVRKIPVTPTPAPAPVAQTGERPTAKVENPISAKQRGALLALGYTGDLDTLNAAAAYDLIKALRKNK